MRNWAGQRGMREKMKRHHLSYMMDWDTKSRTGNQIEWPKDNEATIGLTEDILSGRIPITESLMRRVRPFPQIRKLILQLIFLKQAGVKLGEDTRRTD